MAKIGVRPWPSWSSVFWSSWPMIRLSLVCTYFSSLMSGSHFFDFMCSKLHWNLGAAILWGGEDPIDAQSHAQWREAGWCQELLVTCLYTAGIHIWQLVALFHKMPHTPNLVRYLKDLLNRNWFSLRTGHGVGSESGIIHVKTLEPDKPRNGGPPEHDAPHPPSREALTSWGASMCLGHGSSWMAFLYLCHSQQTMALRWLSICVFVVNNNSDFKTWDPCLQHCNQGNIMLSRPIKTLWFEVLWNHRMSWMKVDARVNVQWGAAHSCGLRDDASLCEKWHCGAGSSQRENFTRFYLVELSLSERIKIKIYVFFNVSKQVHPILLTEWIHANLGTQLWVCIFQNRCTSLAHVKT